MKTSRTNNQKGFTLIEILLYMALSTIMVVLMGGIGVNVFSGFVKAKAAEELQYNTQFVTERVRGLVSEATAISAPAPGETASVLELEMNDPSKNPTMIEVVDGQVVIQEGQVDPEVVSGSSVMVQSGTFSNVTYDGGAGSLRVLFQLGLRNPEDRTMYFASSTIQTTINLRYP